MEKISWLDKVTNVRDGKSRNSQLYHVSSYNFTGVWRTGMSTMPAAPSSNMF